MPEHPGNGIADDAQIRGICLSRSNSSAMLASTMQLARLLNGG